MPAEHCTQLIDSHIVASNSFLHSFEQKNDSNLLFRLLQLRQRLQEQSSSLHRERIVRLIGTVLSREDVTRLFDEVM